MTVKETTDSMRCISHNVIGNISVTRTAAAASERAREETILNNLFTLLAVHNTTRSIIHIAFAHTVSLHSTAHITYTCVECHPEILRARMRMFG